MSQNTNGSSPYDSPDPYAADANPGAAQPGPPPVPHPGPPPVPYPGPQHAQHPVPPPAPMMPPGGFPQQPFYPPPRKSSKVGPILIILGLIFLWFVLAVGLPLLAQTVTLLS